MDSRGFGLEENRDAIETVSEIDKPPLPKLGKFTPLFAGLPSGISIYAARRTVWMSAYGGRLEPLTFTGAASSFCSTKGDRYVLKSGIVIHEEVKVIPLIDLAAQQARVRDKIEAGIARVLAHGNTCGARGCRT